MRQRTGPFSVFAVLIVGLALPLTAQPVPASISLSSGTTCSESAGVTVALTAVAPAGGTIVQLASSHPAVVKVPASVTVPEKTTSAIFKALCNSQSQNTTVSVTATAGGVSKSIMVTVPGTGSISDGSSNTIGAPSATATPVPASLTLQSGSTFVASATVEGGQSKQARVTTNITAGSNGATVSIRSSNTAIATVPNTITIPAGQNSAIFTVNTVAVQQSAIATITAVVGTVSKSAPLTVAPIGSISDGTSNTIGFGETPPPPVPVSVVFPRELSSVGPIVGGQSQLTRVTMNAPAPAAGASVSLHSSHPSVAPVPPSLTIPAGQTSVSFTIATLPVTQSTSVTITAIVGTVSRAATLAVAPAISDGTSNTIGFSQGSSSLTVTPERVVGGAGASGRVDSTASSANLTIQLSSSDPSAATVPASVPLSAGQTSSTFAIATSPVAQSKLVTISSTLAGNVKTDTLTVDPPTIVALSLSQTSATANTTVTGTVRMSGPVHPDLVVAVSTSDAAATTIKTGVVFPRGSTTGTFSLVTGQVKSETLVVITVASGRDSTIAGLRVTP